MFKNIFLKYFPIDTGRGVSGRNIWNLRWGWGGGGGGGRKGVLTLKLKKKFQCLQVLVSFFLRRNFTKQSTLYIFTP